MRHWIAVLATLLTVGASHAAEKSVAEEILDTLWGNGQITDEQYGVLLEKARSEKELTPSIGASDNGSWMDRSRSSGTSAGVTSSSGTGTTPPDPARRIGIAGAIGCGSD
jgi:hypothetical protein